MFCGTFPILSNVTLISQYASKGVAFDVIINIAQCVTRQLLVPYALDLKKKKNKRIKHCYKIRPFSNSARSEKCYPFQVLPGLKSTPFHVIFVDFSRNVFKATVEKSNFSTNSIP
jgi:hypothetical protein